MEDITQLGKFSKILELKGYSPNIINAYMSALKLFQIHTNVKYWNSLSDTDIQNVCFNFFSLIKL